MRFRFPLVLLAGLVLAAPAVADTWVETTGDDFGDGFLSDNLYASMRAGGAVEFNDRWDLNHDGWIDLVCADDSGPWLHLYYGSADGYDTSRSVLYPSPGGGGVAFADLDCDGWAELIHSGWSAGTMVIYHGTPAGPSPDDTTLLVVTGRAEAVTAHDIDRDGWLDLVVGNTVQQLEIFWGSSVGHSNGDLTTLTLDGSIGHNIDVADYDRDGWPDIACVPWTRGLNPVIYWGPNRVQREIAWLPVSDSNPHGVTSADFNSDGWLDLVFSHYLHRTLAFVYWGGPDGFAPDRRDSINPELCYGGSAAVDWNGDSLLDIVFFSGDYGGDTALLPVVYFNGPDSNPRFSDSRRRSIGDSAFNAAGGLVADLDRDGALDLYCDSYNAEEPSLVLWGPDWTARDTLPAKKAHHGIAREIGNVYDRGFHEDYASSVFDAGRRELWQRLSWDDSAPVGTSVALALRSGDTPTPDSTWSGWLALASGDSIPDTLASRYLQYRALFAYDNPCVLPRLEEVRIDHLAWPFHDVGALAIIAPAGAVDSGTVHAPTAVVRNFGNRDETFPVWFEIGGGYAESLAVTLAPGAESTLAFPDWTALTVGTFTTTCYTALDADEKRDNDTVADTVRVLEPPKPDVGPTRIIVPAGSVDSGTTVVPLVEVTNFGPLAVTFPVTLAIGAGWSETVTDSLAVGAVDTVAFPDWMVDRVDTIRLLCFTSLAGDGNRRNDTLAAEFIASRPPPPDVGATAVILPATTPDSGEVFVPRVVVRNYGPYRSGFPTVLVIAGGYRETVFDTLDVGGVDTLSFPSWIAQPVGSLAVTAWTELERDGDRGNDTARASVTVLPYPVHDVGAYRILEPLGALEARDTTKPRALIRNYGNRVEHYFDVRFRIGADYNRPVVVDQDLRPGDSLEVLFPEWVATAGALIASCSTALTTDDAPANDKVTTELSVHQPYRLEITPDTSDRLATGASGTWRFRARLTSDTALVVAVPPAAAPAGWTAELLDLSGERPLGETLGLLQPYADYEFNLRVTAPGPDLAGIADSLPAVLPVAGYCLGAPALADTARLRILLLPDFAVHNFPNPLHSTTRFIFGLPGDGRVSLRIFTRAGELVRRVLDDAPLGAGVRTVDWDATNDAGRAVASGTYTYVFTWRGADADASVTKKLVVVRE